MKKLERLAKAETKVLKIIDRSVEALTADAVAVVIVGVAYDYDDQLDRVISASRAPSTRAFPRVASLVNSVLTRTAGALDYQASLGVDRAFARSGLGLDLMRSSDAITGDDSTSLSASWRYDLNARLGLQATLGLTETDGLDSIGFAGLGLSFRN